MCQSACFQKFRRSLFFKKATLSYFVHVQFFTNSKFATPKKTSANPTTHGIPACQPWRLATSLLVGSAAGLVGRPGPSQSFGKQQLPGGRQGGEGARRCSLARGDEAEGARGRLLAAGVELNMFFLWDLAGAMLVSGTPWWRLQKKEQMFILKWFTMWPRFYWFWCGFILRCWLVWVPWPRWPWMSMEGWPGLWFLWRSKAYLVMSVQLQLLYLNAWSGCLHLGGRSWWWSSTNGKGCTFLGAKCSINCN